MNVLGISQTNLGSSAALYSEGQLSAVMEERLDREKFSSVFPREALEWCLSDQGLTAGDVDAVGFYFSSANYLETMSQSEIDYLGSYPEALFKVTGEWIKKADVLCDSDMKHIRQSLELFEGTAVDIYFIDHHLAHAAGSFYPSPYDDAAILSVDGVGDGTCVSYSVGHGNSIEMISRQSFPHSLGQFYSTLTQFLGFRPNSDEYKVMGLGAYGDGSKYIDEIRELITLREQGQFELDMNFFDFPYETANNKFSSKLIEHLGLEPNKDTRNVDQPYRDLAAAVQKATEQVLEHMVTFLHKEVDEDRLCYSGGVALNVLANGNVVRDSGFDDVYIPPNPGDAGLSVGCALYVANERSETAPSYVYDSDYLGPSYDDEDLKSKLDEAGVSYRKPENLSNVVAQHLSNKNVICHFDGSLEFGPRALGNRSILADPRDQSMKKRVNNKIKFREPFRPFAPSCLREVAEEIFHIEGNAVQMHSPESFMLRTASVREKWKTKLEAVVHEDGTSRLQVVHEESNKKFHGILKAFEKDTGVPVLLNTSFNVKGEPIVCTPEDALHCFYSTGLDVLVMGPYIIEK